MDDAKDAAKEAKKAAKAQAKLQKKLAKKGVESACADAPQAPPPSGTAVESGPTPAERSAAAAERQISLQRYRVWISLLIALIALVTFLITVKPWTLLGSSDRHPVVPTTAADDSS